jgi:hypothetical protein
MTELINEQDIKTRIDFINKTFVRDEGSDKLYR